MRRAPCAGPEGVHLGALHVGLEGRSLWHRERQRARHRPRASASVGWAPGARSQETPSQAAEPGAVAGLCARSAWLLWALAAAGGWAAWRRKTRAAMIRFIPQHPPEPHWNLPRQTGCPRACPRGFSALGPQPGVLGAAGAGGGLRLGPRRL